MLEIQNLGFARGKNVLFENLNFSVKAGEAFRVTGSNGSGKTTLLRIVSGLCRPDNGVVIWDRDLARKNNSEFVKSVNFLGHDDGLKKQLTATENLKLMLPLLGASPSDRDVESALDAAGLEAVKHKPVMHMSAGQKRRVALTRLDFMNHRVLWILDEPFTSLDVTAISGLVLKLRKHIDSGGLLIFTTHQDFDVVSEALSLSLD
ncbi:MAG: cytochrome c biogenesis heme-transporting ATPase CcmA [Burkholderiales bacterium]|nr:cytochrome c biogenesis heme-transporting ATPase CcmA [Burkholderiales bacterium]OUT76860.1 MAG: heme ABC exporter ATP-binding protein CcmA [Betaproteobacteria bacterium TMED22]|tara:strand:+ start:127 stop:741 length:615 start_codon:yes stop_codon:yes gene_type:complete